MFEHCKETWGTKLVVTGTKELPPLPDLANWVPPMSYVTQRMLQRVTIVAYRDTAEYTLYPMITLPKFLKIHSLPKVLARISNVWVHMWGIMQL